MLKLRKKITIEELKKRIDNKENFIFQVELNEIFIKNFLEGKVELDYLEGSRYATFNPYFGIKESIFFITYRNRLDFNLIYEVI